MTVAAIILAALAVGGILFAAIIALIDAAMGAHDDIHGD
jgi:hypothetical protein